MSNDGPLVGLEGEEKVSVTVGPVSDFDESIVGLGRKCAAEDLSNSRSVHGDGEPVDMGEKGNRERIIRGVLRYENLKASKAHGAESGEEHRGIRDKSIEMQEVQIGEGEEGSG